MFGQYTGWLDAASCSSISGWAENTNTPNSVINVDLYDGSNYVTTVSAGYFRQDLLNAGYDNGYHAYTFGTPSSLIDGNVHSLSMRPAGTSFSLYGSPKSITCTPATNNYAGSLDSAGCATINGWVFDRNNPNTTVTVGVYVDGSTNPVATFAAGSYRSDLPPAGIGNGYHAFSIPTPSAITNGAHHSVSVRPLGWTPEALYASPASVTCGSHEYHGWVDTANCTVIQGWAADLDNPTVTQTVTIYLDGWPISTVQASSYRSDVAAAGIGTGYYGFAIPSPVPTDGNNHTITAQIGTTVLPSSTPFVFSCSAGTPSNPARVTRYDVGGSCGVAELTVNTTPTFNSQAYSLDSTSGFYVTAGQDTLSAAVQVVWQEWTQGDTFSATAGFYRSVYGSPSYDSPAAGNSLVTLSSYTTSPFNPTGLDAGSPNGGPSQGNYYFGGVGTLTTCRTSVTYAPIMFYVHVTAAPSISSITPSTFPAGVPTQLTINGNGFGQAGAIEFSGPGNIPPVNYTTSSPTQVVVTVTAPNAGTYNVDLQERKDVDGFSFQQPAAQGQPPKSPPKTVTATAPPPKLNVTSSSTQNLNGGSGIPSMNNCAMIDGTPLMPTITARVVDPNTGQPVQSGTAQFNLRLEFDQYSGPPGVQTTLMKHYLWELVPGGMTSLMSASNPWQPQLPRVLGGTATLSWSYNGVAQSPVQFCVKAYNPYYSDLYPALDSGSYWFRRYVANHETNASQFCEPGRMQAAWCGGGYWGQPVWGSPQGYGVLQLDPPQGAPPVPVLSDDDAYEAIWNWKANLQQWDVVAGTKAGVDGQDQAAYTFWVNQVEQWRQWNSIPANAQVGPLADTQEANCTFSFGDTPDSQSGHPQGIYWFGDPILMKQFGGAPMNYVSFLSADINNPRWNFCRSNSVNANVVYEFCTCQQATGCQRQVYFPPAPQECKTQ